MRPNLLRAKYTMAARRSILATLTVLCLIYIVAWWYMSQYGPGGRHVYGITSLSWQNSTAPGVGTLTVALDRTPANDVQGGAVQAVSPGTTVLPATTAGGLTPAQATAVGASLGGLEAKTATAIDKKVKTVSLMHMRAPAGWPGSAPNAFWTAATTTKSGKASGTIKITPATGP